MCSCKSSRKLGVSTEARIGESALFLLCQSSHLTQSVFCTIAQISCSGGSQGHRESVFHIIHWVDQKVHSYFSAKTLIGKIGTNFFFFFNQISILYLQYFIFFLPSDSHLFRTIFPTRLCMPEQND